jgi:hypothetical protein
MVRGAPEHEVDGGQVAKHVRRARYIVRLQMHKKEPAGCRRYKSGSAASEQVAEHVCPAWHAPTNAKAERTNREIGVPRKGKIGNAGTTV